ncbi:hypothetical protein JTB14_014654 [Gonioctena quinquepunctata]|nr:hypothetical protein JTB14_014654 [Gonioctena quinquepunctata]
MHHLIYKVKYLNTFKMFKFFAVVFAAILAVAVAAPKPGLIASPSIASSPLAYSAYSAPLTTYATGYSGYSPLAYSSYNSYAYPAGYAAPLIQY